MTTLDSGSDSRLDSSVDRSTVQPWGFWATVGWSLMVQVLFILTQTLGVGWMIAQRLRLEQGTDPLAVLESLERDGSLITLVTFLSSLTCASAILAVAAFRQSGSPWTYLQIHFPALRPLGQWLLITLGTILTIDTLKGIFGLEIVPQFSIDIYTTAASLPLLFIAVGILAPVYEEMMFRGFLFQGFRFSRLGPRGAIVLTALIWAVIHTQYDWINILTIFLYGVLFGVAQLRTQCLVIPMAMHILNNVISLVQAGWKIYFLN